MQLNNIPKPKKNLTLVYILIVALCGVCMYRMFATYKPWSVATATIEGTGYTLWQYLDLVEEMKLEQKQNAKVLIVKLLEIKAVESHLKQNGVDYKNSDYLLYETGGTTYKIWLEIVK